MKSVLGCLLFLIALPPFNIGYAGLFCLVPLFIDNHQRSIRQSLLYGAMVGAFLSTYIFLGIKSYSLDTYLFIVFLFIFTFAILFAFYRFTVRRNPISTIVLVPTFWLLIELLYSHFHIPFSYAIFLSGSPALIQAAAFGGQILVSILALAFQIGIVIAFTHMQGRHTIHKLQLIPAFIAFLFLGFFLLNRAEPENTTYIKVAIIQSDIPPVSLLEIASYKKLEQLHKTRTAFLDKIEELPDKPDLVLWPEVSFARYEFRNQNNLAAEAKKRRLNMLVASPDLTPSGRLLNAVFSVSRSGEVLHRHTKSILIPFLENDISNGISASPHTRLPGSPGSLICYESAFSEPAILLSQKGAGLITISTNDAYAGPSFLPMIHNTIARLRAVETRKTVLRAANGGPSSIFSHRGYRLLAADLFMQDVLSLRVPIIREVSFYAKHYSAIRITYFITCIAPLVFLAISILRNKTVSRTTPASRLIIIPALGVIFLGLTANLFQINCITYQFLKSPLNVGMQAFNNSSYGPPQHSQLYYLSAETPLESLMSSLAYLLREYGNTIESTALFPLNRNATQSFEDLNIVRKIVENYGYHLKRRRDNIGSPNIPSIHTPSIARLDTGESIVIKDYQPNAVVFFSPSEGNVISVSRKAFDRKWNGESLYFLPKEKPWDTEYETSQP